MGWFLHYIQFSINLPNENNLSLFRIEKAVLLKQIVIVGGTHYLSPNESVEFILRDIVKEVTHPRYVKGVAAHDISILTVREKFAFDDRVRLTRIRMSDESIQDGSICQVLAWGTQVNVSN